MNKTELVEYIATETGLSKKDSQGALEAFLKATTVTLKKQDPVILVGFGTFETQKRKARIGRNPQTGEALKIKASIVPRFRPSKTLKGIVNNK